MDKGLGIKKWIAIIVGYIVLLIFIVKFVDFSDLLFYKFPSRGTYYFWLESDDKDRIIGHTYYIKYISDEELDLENIIIKQNPSPKYDISEKLLHDDDALRLLILENGIGIIKDERFASENELKAQEKASSEGLGYWKNQESKNETIGRKIIISGRKVVNLFYRFIDSINLLEVFVWLIFTGIGLSTIIMLIYRAIMRKRIVIVFFGEPASGKTTFINRVLDLLADADKFKNTPSTSGKGIIGFEERNYKGYTIKQYAIDNSGTTTGLMFEDLAKYKYCKKVAVIMLAYSDDHEKVLKETSKALIVSRIINQQSQFKNVKKLLFINKADMFCDRSDFFNNPKRIYSLFECEEFKELVKNVDYYTAGSAVEGWHVGELMSETIPKEKK